jgi:hypothetical protein
MVQCSNGDMETIVPMTNTIVPMTNTYIEPLFSLRVLTERDKNYGVYVARCLETGHVVTADDAKTAIEMMKELLEDEMTYAIEHLNFPNLLSTPASADVWTRWLALAAKHEVKKYTLNINARELRLDDEVGEVSTEIRFAAVQ